MLPHGVWKLTRRGHRIDEAPGDGPLSLDPFDERAEVVCDIPANATFVHESRETARPWQYTKQRRFRQADHRMSIIHEQNLVAGERQFVAAPGAGAVDRGEKLDARLAARILDR